MRTGTLVIHCQIVTATPEARYAISVPGLKLRGFGVNRVDSCTDTKRIRDVPDARAHQTGARIPA